MSAMMQLEYSCLCQWEPTICTATLASTSLLWFCSLTSSLWCSIFLHIRITTAFFSKLGPSCDKEKHVLRQSIRDQFTKFTEDMMRMEYWKENSGIPLKRKENLVCVFFFFLSWFKNVIFFFYKSYKNRKQRWKSSKGVKDKPFRTLSTKFCWSSESQFVIMSRLFS